MSRKLFITASIVFLVIFALSVIPSFLGGESASAKLLDASGLLGQDNYTSSVSGSGDNKFDGSQGVTLDSSGHRLFVSDESNNRVLVFKLDNKNQIIDKTADYVIGQTNFTSTANGRTQNRLYWPSEVFYDSDNGRLFVSDKGNYRIMVFNLSGGITNGMNASYVLGQADFTSRTTGLSAGIFGGANGPSGIAYDSWNKRLFISDMGNHRVMVFNLSGGITNGMNASYVLGQADFTSKLSGAAQNTFSHVGPTGILYDIQHQRLFVSDYYSNNRVMVFNLSGGITNGMNASYVLGQADFTSTNSSNIPSQSNIRSPLGIAYDSDREKLFISDIGHGRVIVFNLSGGITNGMNASYVLGQADFTSSKLVTSSSSISSPSGIFYDSQNRKLFVADFLNNRILSFDIGLRISAVKQGQTEDLALNQIHMEAIDDPSIIMIPDITPHSLSGGKLLLTTPNHIQPSSWWSGTYEGCMVAGDRAGFSMFGSPYPNCGSSGVLEFKQWKKTGITQLPPESGDTPYDIRVESISDQPGNVSAVYDTIAGFSIKMCVNNDPFSCHRGGQDYSYPIVLEKSEGGSQTLPFQTIVDADSETGDVVDWQVEEVAYYNSATGAEVPNSSSPIRNPDYDSGNPGSQEYLSAGIDADGNTVNVPEYPELSSGIEFVPNFGTCTAGDGGGLSDRCIKFSTTDNVKKVRVKATVWHKDGFASVYFNLLLVPPQKLSCALSIDPTEIYSGMSAHTTNETAVLYSRLGYDSTLNPYWRIDWKNGSLSTVGSGYTVATVQSGIYDSLGSGDKPEMYFTDISGTRLVDSSDMVVQPCFVDLKVKKKANDKTWPVSPNR